VAQVEISGNINQLTAYERIPADASRGLALFGGSVFTFGFIASLGASNPLLIAFLAIAFPLSAHALSKRLTKPLRIVLTMILLSSLGTVGYAYLGQYQASLNAPSVTPNTTKDNFAEYPYFNH
jgi:hypothetical protein